MNMKNNNQKMINDNINSDNNKTYILNNIKKINIIKTREFSKINILKVIIKLNLILIIKETKIIFFIIIHQLLAKRIKKIFLLKIMRISCKTLNIQKMKIKKDLLVLI